jgi:DNA polymerase-3 subunit delta'
MDAVMADVESAWATVVGQNKAVAALRSWSMDPMHAYLFVGPSGTGKRQVARAFSATVQAQHFIGDDAGRERQLRLALQDKHPDVEIYEPEGPQLLVKAVTEAIIPSVFRKPADGPRRIIVIDRFHDANPGAAAAMLKTVEEPPPNAIIILLAESVPLEHVAIASRCSTIEFPPLSRDDLAGWIADHGVGPDNADVLIEASGGDLRRLELLTYDSGFAERSALWQGLPTAIDGTGATAGHLVRELVAMMAAASEPLTVRHARELEELDAREEMLGTRGSGRSGVDARHKRELRKLRTDEVRFGLRVLARRYSRALADGGGREIVDAVSRLRQANDALIRNPNETLLLHNLFWNLPPLRS